MSNTYSTHQGSIGLSHLRERVAIFFIGRCACGCANRKRIEQPLYHSQQILSSVFLEKIAQKFFLILCNLPIDKCRQM
jgi:hypothetical protein